MKHHFIVSVLFYFICTFSYGQQTDSLTLFHPITIDSIVSHEDLPGEDDAENLKENSTNVSSLLTASNNPFASFAAFHFNAFRFNPRGYDGNTVDFFINGVNVKSLSNGFIPFTSFSGLNEVMRFRERSYGLQPMQYAFGNAGSSVFVDMSAGRQRKQTTIAAALSNGNIQQQAGFSHATGFNRKGWAMAFCLNLRSTNEGYVAGTFYTGKSFCITVDKKQGDHLFSAILIGAATERGKQTASTPEMQEIIHDNYYNPGWGYLNGNKRNANVTRQFQPWLIVSHKYSFTSGYIRTAIAASYGERSDTGLDWYNAPDPRPDYYLYMPNNIADSNQKQLVYRNLQSTINLRQINWHHLYQTNKLSNETIHDANGIKGNDITGRLSRYIVEKRRDNQLRLILNSSLVAQLSPVCEFSAGFSYQVQNNHFYKTIDDLLGGDFFVNLNRFGESNAPVNPSAIQYDIDCPNRVLKTGDRYGYDYTLHIQEGRIWFQNVFRLHKVDIFIASQIVQNIVWRQGNIRNGLFSDQSAGNSLKFLLPGFGVKLGATYKINGRNYLILNLFTSGNPPLVEDIFLSPRMHNGTQETIKNGQTYSMEFGYTKNTHKLKIQVTAFLTQFKDQMNRTSFYHDELKSFVNYSLNGIDKIHYGIEFGLEYKLMRNVLFNAAASIGRYYYTNRPMAIITADNSAALLGKETIFMNHYRIPNTPQEIYGAGITYKSPHYWLVSLSSALARERWLDFNPVRRTKNAIDGIASDSKLAHNILDQVRLPDAQTVDLFASYSVRIKRQEKRKQNAYLAFNLSINNLTNNRNIILSGYEQYRFDFANKDVNKFQPRMTYAFGTTFYTGITYRF